MSYTTTVTVTDNVLLVRTPDDIVLLRTVGEVRSFTAPTEADIVITETKNAAFAPSSSWIGKGVTEEVQTDPLL